MRGRKPGAPELRVIKGDLRVRGAAVANPPAPASGEPVLPPWFDEAHTAKWDEVVGLMREMGTLGRELGDVIRLYVEASIEAEKAREHVREHGAVVPAPRTGVPMHSPYRAVARQAEAMMVKLGSELGLTPSGRGRIGTKKKEAGNPFAGHGKRG